MKNVHLIYADSSRHARAAAKESLHGLPYSGIAICSTIQETLENVQRAAESHMKVVLVVELSLARSNNYILLETVSRLPKDRRDTYVTAEYATSFYKNLEQAYGCKGFLIRSLLGDQLRQCLY